MSQNATPLVIGISSSALFDTRESDEFFKNHEIGEYVGYQVERADKPFEKGTAFPLVEMLMKLDESRTRFELVVMSKNEPAAGIRVMKSLDAYGLKGTRAAFTGGEPVANYCRPMGVDLFLSREVREVKRALRLGVAGGQIYERPAVIDVDMSQLRIAFDFDGVLAADDSDKLFKSEGLLRYQEHETKFRDVPLKKGPLFPAFEALMRWKNDLTATRKKFFDGQTAPDAKELAAALKISATVAEELIAKGFGPKRLFQHASEEELETAGFTPEVADDVAARVRRFLSPIEIALVTARNPPVDMRLFTTLQSWGVEMDEMFLMGIKPKEPVLREFRPHIFFDDSKTNTELAAPSVPTSFIPAVTETVVSTTATSDAARVPSVTATSASPADNKTVRFPSSKEFETACREIFSRYVPSTNGKPGRLDPEFLTFIRVNKGKPAERRAVVLERLRKYDLSNLDNHAPMLGRTRADDLKKRLKEIGGDDESPELPLNDGENE